MALTISLARIVLGALVAALACATGATFLGPLHWTAELTTHFRVQLAVGASGLVALAAVARQPFWAIAALLLGIAQAVPVLDSLRDASPVETTADAGPPLRVLLANVLTRNRAHERLLAFVREEDPDIVGLLEVDRHWIAALEPLRASHPYRIEHPRSNNFGIAMYSRIPFETIALRPLGHPGLMAVVAELRFDDEPLALALAHPVPPVSGTNARLRNLQLDRLAEWRGEFEGHPFILIGDLNATPWSPRFAQLERRSGLRNAARGHGYFPTWETEAPHLALPLDHCLLSSGLRAVAFATGPDIGSDHRPVLVDILLRR